MTGLLQPAGEALGIGLFLLSHAIALLIIPLGLPGTFLQVAAAALLTAATGTRFMGWSWVMMFLGMAILGEVAEFFSGQWGARRFAGSHAAAWGALLGGLAGALVGSATVPFLGSVLGSFAGTFAGAVAGEMYHQQRTRPDLRVGTGALLGRVAGIAVKLFLAVLMLICSIAVLLAQLVAGAAP